MRRLVAWIGGVVGGIAAYRFVRRQEAALQTAPEPTAPPPEPDDRAEELRAKLAESRADAAELLAEEPTSSEEPTPSPEPEPASSPEPEPASSPEPEPASSPEPEPEPESPEERRRRVHDEGRAALDEMRSE